MSSPPIATDLLETLIWLALFFGGVAVGYAIRARQSWKRRRTNLKEHQT